MRGPHRSQRGIVAVFAAIGLVALLVMVGLALDTGHLVLNKSRLQSGVDAAALAAAKVLDETGSEAQASVAARNVFDANAAQLSRERHAPAGADLEIQYSTALAPFVPGSAPPNYVRVRADELSMWTSFTALLGFDELSTAASAVAGPSAPITEPGDVCDVVPLMVCADMSAGEAGHWGYQTDNVTVLKLASNAPSPVGPGNFQLIEIGGSGADVLRHNLAGDYHSCLDLSGTVTTKTGNNAGPTAQGLNTRFGRYSGGGMNASAYPPDKIITETSPALALAADGVTVVMRVPGGDVPVTHIDQVSFNYDDYTRRMEAGDFDRPSGVAKRRVLGVPIVDCTTMVNGHGTLPLVGLGCFFLLQQVVQVGNENFVYSQYIDHCAAAGPPGPDPGTGTGVYKIVLHNDPDNSTS